MVGDKDKAKAREASPEGETVDDGAVLPPEEGVVTANEELPKEAARTASKSSKEKAESETNMVTRKAGNQRSNTRSTRK